MPQTSANPAASSQPPTASSKNDIFVSYSRKDKAFVEKLDAALRQAGRDPWIDWEDIRKGEDWWQSIQRGIEAADTFVFVVSPDSVASKVCRDEVDYATQLNKRFLPMLHREGFEMANVHPSIARHNWLFFREADDLNQGYQELFKALDTDLDYVRAHTRLLVRSLEWQNQAQDPSYLLRGKDLDDAQAWITQGLNKAPHPTNSQAAYISASEAAKIAALKARQKAKWIVVLTAVIANCAFVTVGLWLIADHMIALAETQLLRDTQDTLRGAIYGIDGDEFEALAQLDVPPGQDEPQDNPLYERHQQWLETINQIEPLARPVTYAQGSSSGEGVEAIGDIFRASNPEEASWFRQFIPFQDTLHDQALEAGFEQSSISLGSTDLIDLDEHLYEYEDGHIALFVYAPIQNSTGQSVGVLELEYEPQKLTDIEETISGAMQKAGLIALIWFLISSVLILKVTQPTGDA